MATKAKKITTKDRKKTSGTNKKTTQSKALRAAQSATAKAVRNPAQRGRTPQISSPALQLVQDHIAIEQLLNRYCRVVDHDSLDEIMALFHRDPVLIVRLEQEEYCQGREAVRGWYTRWIDSVRSRVRYMRHRITSPVIEIVGNEANAACYLDGDSTSFSNKTVVIQGEYTDRLIKEDGRWLLKQRTISGFSTYALATVLMSDPSASSTATAGVR